jgi:hypothetical protein
MWFAIYMLEDSSSFWFQLPTLGTGSGAAVAGATLLGIGGLLGAHRGRRKMDKLRRR